LTLDLADMTETLRSGNARRIAAPGLL
jgi:hypothetical protein